MKRAPWSWLCLTALVVATAGCKVGANTSSNPPAAAPIVSNEPITAVPDKDRYKVIADTTGFFHYSPLQASGSDFDLKKDARLTMIKRGRGFSEVKTADKDVGYVGTEDIAPLAPAELAQEDAATMQAAQAAAGAQLAAAGLTNTAPVTAPNGKKTGTPMSSYKIPSAADADVRLPEPDVKRKPTPSPSPGVNFR